MDESGKKLGTISYDQAMWLAYERGYDLVEVGPNAQPPVAKLIDYNKELYERAKQIRKQRAQHKAPEVKEIKLSFNISRHDIEVRVKKAQDFFGEGHKVKVFLFLKGRENIFRDKANKLITDFTNEASAEFDAPIKRQGNCYFAIIKRK
ncbi:MAG: translation initiation factor IF-3 [Patescibacteria group bacterium]|nr:translation initiation factor IF-3 [Patescibacteria group bacterium]